MSPDGWVYHYDVGEKELSDLREHWDIVQLARDKMQGAD